MANRYQPLDLAAIAHLLQVGRADLAERELRCGLADDPDSAQLHGLLSQALDRLGRAEAAWEEGEIALRLAPNDPTPHRWLGTLALKLDRLDKAEEYGTQAVRLDPDAIANLRLLGLLAYKRQEVQLAAELCERVLAAEPANAFIHALYALSLVDLGKGKSAKTHAQRALELDPGDAENWQTAGLVSLLTGNPYAALRYFRTARRMEPADTAFKRQFWLAMKVLNPLYFPAYAFSLYVIKPLGEKWFLWLWIGSVLVLRIWHLTAIQIGLLGFVAYIWLARLWSTIWDAAVERWVT